MELVVPARAVVLALICILLASCQNPQASWPATSVEFTKVPAAGPPGRVKLDLIEGRVIGARSGERIVLYAKGGALWWVQPFANAPFTAVQPNSTWRNSTHLGTEYAALLVKPGYKPLSITESLPAKTGNVVAMAIVQGSGYKPAIRKTVHFSGHDWEAREDPSDSGGKSNLYDPENAWTDACGFLHLRINSKGGRWLCAEVRLKHSLGQGSYLFTVHDSSRLEPAAVLNVHTYDEFAVDQNHREIDIEISRWGELKSKNAQYVIQPYYEPANVARFDAPAGTLTYSFRWEMGKVAFRTFRGSTTGGNSRAISEHSFTSGIPSPGRESIRLSLYAFGNTRNPLRNGAEVVIEKFQYIP
jgi:hypothetical protein